MILSSQGHQTQLYTSCCKSMTTPTTAQNTSTSLVKLCADMLIIPLLSWVTFLRSRGLQTSPKVFWLIVDARHIKARAKMCQHREERRLARLTSHPAASWCLTSVDILL